MSPRPGDGGAQGAAAIRSSALTTTGGGVGVGPTMTNDPSDATTR